MPYTVNASGITKSFGGTAALDHVNLAIETGSVFALLGPNGAGKTTLVRILATLVRPDAGTATVAGHDLVADPDGVRRSISLTGQYAAVDDKLTGRENLEMMGQLLRLSRMKARVRASELLAEFDLADAAGRRAGKYSGGMRRRLDLAISMIARPPLVFLDEPTTGLDPRSREQTWSTVRRLVDEGVTVLLTTQYLEEADQLADTVAVLDHGRVVAQGTPDELKARLGAEVVRLQFAGLADYERALGGLDPVRTDHRLLTIDVATEGTASEIFRILGRLQAAGAPADKVSTYRPSLDDVFLSVTATATATGAAVTGRRAAAGAAQAEAHTEAKEMAR
jgi:ABC-2 type transport system ATP-binding protein